MSSLSKFIIIIAVYSSRVLYLDCSISARLLKLTKPFQTFSGKLTYSAPDMGAEYCDERVCLSVCLCVCLCVCVCVYPQLYLGNYTSDLQQFFWRVIYGVVRSGSGSVVIRYVLPVL